MGLEKPGQARILEKSGVGRRRKAKLVLDPGVGAGLEKAADYLGVVPADGHDEGGLAILALPVQSLPSKE